MISHDLESDSEIIEDYFKPEDIPSKNLIQLTTIGEKNMAYISDYHAINLGHENER